MHCRRLKIFEEIAIVNGNAPGKGAGRFNRYKHVKQLHFNILVLTDGFPSLHPVPGILYRLFKCSLGGSGEAEAH